MKPTNLLIIGGAVVLGGIYLVNNSNENKEKAKALAEAQALEEAKVKEQQDADKVLEDARIKKQKEEQARQELAKRYSVTEAGVKALDTITKTNTLFTANPLASNPLILQSLLLNSYFKNQDELKTRDVWTKNYSSIYKDIKDYYFSIYKDEVTKLQDILPKLIVAKSMGNFGDKSKKILTSEDEIFLIDNNLNREDVLKNALKQNYNLLFPDNSDISKRITIESAIYGESNNNLDIKNIVTELIKKGKYSFMATSSFLGRDPSYRRVKYVMINYSIDGKKVPLATFNSLTPNFRTDIDGVREGNLVTLLPTNS